MGYGYVIVKKGDVCFWLEGFYFVNDGFIVEFVKKFWFEDINDDFLYVYGFF